jgi:hypothetical protein
METLDKNLIDFTVINSELLTGRKHGERSKKNNNFKIIKADKYYFKIGRNQLVTSSYIIGLLENEIQELINKYDNLNDVIKCFNLNEVFNKESKEEIIRGVRRLFYNTRALIKQTTTLNRNTHEIN